MNIRNYILETFGGVHYKWDLKKFDLWKSKFEKEGDSFQTTLQMVHEYWQDIYRVIADLPGSYWKIDIDSLSGYKFDVNDKSKKVLHVVINQLKDLIRSKNPTGFIFKLHTIKDWVFLRLIKEKVEKTISKTLGYDLVKAKIIDSSKYLVFKKK